MSAENRGFDTEHEFTRGVERLRAVLGDSAGDRLIEQVRRAEGGGDASRVQLPVAMTWGWLLERPGLSARERSLAMISVDVARGANRALHDHFLLALHLGVNEGQLRELLLQLGPYAGFPSTNDAGHVLTEVMTAWKVGQSGEIDGATRARRGWFDRSVRLERCTLVVSDARRAADMLSMLLGVTTWQVSHLNPQIATIETGGTALDYTMVRAVGVAACGLRFELLEPVAGAHPMHLRLLTQGSHVDSLALSSVSDSDPAAVLDAARAAGVGHRRTITVGDGRSDLVLDSGRLLGGLSIAVSSVDRDVFDAALPVDEEWAPRVSPVDLGLGVLHHVGLVVDDIEARSAGHAQVFGTSRWPVNSFATASGTLSFTRRHGEPESENYLSSIARVGEFAMELCQPVARLSYYRRDFLEPCGEGVQHLFFGAWSRPAQWDEAMAVIRDLGLNLAAEGWSWDGQVRYGYVATRELIGFDLEIALIEEGANIDPAERAVFSFTHPTGAHDSDQEPAGSLKQKGKLT